MNIEELKAKFLQKSVADIKDVDLALRAAPFLIREVVRLEEELKEAEERIKHLNSQFRKQPLTSKKGKKGEAEWDIRLDEKKNRLYFILSGKFDHRSGKSATNHLSMVLESIRKDFDVIIDITNLSPDVSNRVHFHLRKAMYNLQQMGVKSVVRVVDPKANPLSVFEERGKDITFKSFTANSLRDADLTLDNEGKFLKV
ncbi:MAG: hypothetical protein KJ737_04715 [Proteobacteria bacterium]|nr:hypothetical protein [Pseudomonadota bacterium]